MLDTRQTLTTLLSSITTLTDMGVTIIQEDEFTQETAKPAIIVTYEGSDELPGTLFRQESWDLWVVAENSDYWTIGKIAAVLRKELDRMSLPATTGLESAVLRLKWVGDGAAVPDQQYKVHTQIQSYTALVFDVVSE